MRLEKIIQGTGLSENHFDFFGLAIFWATEHFLIQRSLFESPPTTKRPYFFQSARFALNLSAAILVLVFLPRVWLVMLVAADFLLSLILVAHNRYFKRALSLYQAVNHFGEGWKVIPFGIRIVPSAAWTALTGALIVKMLLIFKATSPVVDFRSHWVLACLAAGTMLVIIAGLQRTSFRFANIQISGVTREVYACGYLIAWIAEFFVLPNMKKASGELAELQKVSPDRLSPTDEPEWLVRNHVVVVQLESFGWNLLDYKINGREITPFFNGLARSGRLFKIHAYHSLGTADMDYAVLSGGVPSERIVGYFAPEIPQTNALAGFMQRHGFRTFAFHGGLGSTYNRRSGFEQMGFDEIYFKEDFAGKPVQQSYWGIRDGEIFRSSSEKLATARNPQFHFIMTLDSHGPFDLINDDEKQIFPQSRVWQENFFNSFYLLDQKAREYVESLPAGTLVVFYGDHTSAVEYNGFRPAREGDAEFVPCIVHSCQPSSPWPSRADLPCPADALRINDIMNFLRRQVSRSSHAKTSPGKVN